jgi:hypothetical protein
MRWASTGAIQPGKILPMPEPGWYPDPEDPSRYRRWDGDRWTDDRQPAATFSQYTSAPSPTVASPSPAAASTAPPGRSGPAPSVKGDQPGTSVSGFFRSLFDFSFTTLITTKVIKVVYIIATVAVTLIALVVFVASVTRGGIGIVFGIIVVPIVWLLYLTLVRISLEFTIVIFQIGADVRTIAAQERRAG